jgi:hypothetical protein
MACRLGWTTLLLCLLPSLPGPTMMVATVLVATHPSRATGAMQPGAMGAVGVAVGVGVAAAAQEAAEARDGVHGQKATLRCMGECLRVSSVGGLYVCRQTESVLMWQR